MTTLLQRMRAWLAPLHPRYRRALAKRRLEATCQRHGCTRAVASAICREYFA